MTTLDFTLQTDTGDTLALSSLRGRTVILYFYPKDDTSGCTQESCEFRDLFPRFSEADAVVLGISPDDVKSHQKFKAKFNLPFTLLVDENHALAEQFGLWVEKTFYGKKYMGVERTTFIIGPDGEVKHVFAKVNPAGHADEVMAYLSGGVEAAAQARAAYEAAAAAAAAVAAAVVAPQAELKPAAKKSAKKPAKKPANKALVVAKPAPKKAAPKKSAKKVVKKSVKKVAKKAAKQVVKKVAKKAAKQVVKKVAKKSAKKVAKKVVKKAIKKVAKKPAKKLAKKPAKKSAKKAKHKK